MLERYEYHLFNIIEVKYTGCGKKIRIHCNQSLALISPQEIFKVFQRNTIIYVVEEAKNVWIFLFCNISAIWQGIYYDFLIKGKMVLCSGAVMTDLADRLLGLKLCKELQPWIRRILDIKLVLEFKIPHICVFIWQYNHREVILEMQKN